MILPGPQSQSREDGGVSSQDRIPAISFRDARSRVASKIVSPSSKASASARPWISTHPTTTSTRSSASFRASTLTRNNAGLTTTVLRQVPNHLGVRKNGVGCVVEQCSCRISHESPSFLKMAVQRPCETSWSTPLLPPLLPTLYSSGRS